MEVHHHPHVEKKSLKEYLLEGLMIFLAVSMGFVAENIREKISEHEIEKRNIEIIVDNLKEDTDRLTKIINHSSQRILLLDSIVTFQHHLMKDRNEIKKFASLFLRSSRINLFITNKAAFEQMKSSGSLRLIKSKKVLDSLFKYTYDNDRIEFNSAYISENSNLIVEDAVGFLNFHDVIDGNSAIEIKQTPGDMFKFYNHCIALKVRIASNNNLLLSQKENAVRLINLLREEYDLEK